jgi:hypothetical protein
VEYDSTEGELEDVLAVTTLALAPLALNSAESPSSVVHETPAPRELILLQHDSALLKEIMNTGKGYICYATIHPMVEEKREEIQNRSLDSQR